MNAKNCSGFAALMLIITVLIIAFLMIYVYGKPHGSKPADGRTTQSYPRELIDKAKASAKKASGRTETMDAARKELGLD